MTATSDRSSREWIYERPVTLAGGYNCSLTQAERNEWAIYVRGKREFAIQTAAEGRLRLDPCVENASTAIAADAVLFHVARRWHEGLLERCVFEEVEQAVKDEQK